MALDRTYVSLSVLWQPIVDVTVWQTSKFCRAQTGFCLHLPSYQNDPRIQEQEYRIQKNPRVVFQFYSAAPTACWRLDKLRQYKQLLHFYKSKTQFI